MEVKLKLWRSSHYYILKIPPELEDVFLKRKDEKGYVRIIIPED